MEDAHIEKKLNELVKELGSALSPQNEKIVALTQQSKDAHKQLKSNLDKLQESLDYLRVVIKYQAFDLEATRRENTYLKKLINDRNT